jgi:hypothetical protein
MLSDLGSKARVIKKYVTALYVCLSVSQSKGTRLHEKALLLSSLSHWNGIETCYGLQCRGSIPGRGKRFFCTPQRLGRLWGPTILLYNRQLALYPQGRRVRGVKLTTHLLLVPRSRMVELLFHFSIRLHNVVVN